MRSRPYSRLHPQFNREILARALAGDGVKYVFLGEELGARSQDSACYERGRVQYDRLAATAPFRRGIARLLEGMRTERIAVMCAEKEPLECHRTILVSRHLAAGGAEVRHILPDGGVENHADTIARLIARWKLPEADLVRTREEIEAEAYRLQGERVAYTLPAGSRGPSPI